MHTYNRIVVFILVILSIICLSGCGHMQIESESLSFSPDGKNLVLIGSSQNSLLHESNYRMYRISTDGSDIIPLIDSQHYHSCDSLRFSTQYSPDRKHIMLIREYWNQDPSIMILTAEGKIEQSTYEEKRGRPITWLPNSKGIILINFPDDYPKSNPEFLVKSIASKNEIALPPKALSSIYDGPGFWIIYCAPKNNISKSAVWKVFLGNSNTKPTMITDGQFHIFQADISHDRKKVAFNSDKEPGGIWTIDVNGINPRNILADKTATCPVWSPDNKKIAFLRYNELWIMDSDGNNQKIITSLNSIHQAVRKPTKYGIIIYASFLILIIIAIIQIVRARKQFTYQT